MKQSYQKMTAVVLNLFHWQGHVTSRTVSTLWWTYSSCYVTVTSPSWPTTTWDPKLRQYKFIFACLLTCLLAHLLPCMLALFIWSFTLFLFVCLFFFIFFFHLITSPNLWSTKDLFIASEPFKNLMYIWVKYWCK